MFAARAVIEFRIGRDDVTATLVNRDAWKHEPDPLGIKGCARRPMPVGGVVEVADVRLV
jgi:hypothetical protein